MLQRLYISNYAIISNLTLEPGPNFNVITGETGAGKSILIGALSLILGSKFDTTVLRDAQAKCVIEATFNITEQKNTLEEIFNQEELDWEDVCIIRRELSSKGKSRSFINDTPVTLQQLQIITAHLVDLHQQFDTHILRDQQFQLDVVDGMANVMKERAQYAELYKEWISLNHYCEQLENDWLQQQKDYDYNVYLYEELSALALQPNELEQIEEQIKQAQHKEKIVEQLSAIHQLTSGDDQSIVSRIRGVQQTLHTLSTYLSSKEELHKRVESSYEDWKDLAAEFEQLFDQTNIHTYPNEQLQERYDIGQRLLKKHAVSQTNELISIQENLKLKLDQSSTSEEKIAGIKVQLLQFNKQLQEKANQLHQQRQKVLEPLSNQINELLHTIGMPNAKFQIELEKLDKLDINGSSSISFVMDANRSGSFTPIEKSASGGEMSRIMLAIKTTVADKLYLPTLIFDEIDTGISGEAARQVGILLQQLGSRHQLISITHQPQIAAKANHHFYVFKDVALNGSLQTDIRLLQQEERIGHIAEMITGRNKSEEALAHAKQLLSA